MKPHSWLWLFIALPIFLCADFVWGTTPTQQAYVVTVDELRARPLDYNGKLIRVTGVVMSGFEVSALSDATVEREGLLHLNEPTIWLEGATVTNERQCITVGPPPHAKVCTADVQGIFEFGGRYGHLGGYKAQIGHVEQPRQAEPLETRAELLGSIPVMAQPPSIEPTPSIQAQPLTPTRQPSQPFIAPAQADAGSTTPVQADSEAARNDTRQMP